jgi:hypothetical protein
MPYGGSKFKGEIRKTSVVAAGRKDVFVVVFGHRTPWGTCTF